MKEEILERAALHGASIRCVSHMMPGDRPDNGITDDCAVLVEATKDSATLTRSDFRAEGRSLKRVKIDKTKSGFDRLDAFLSTIATLQMRERAIIGHGMDGLVYPPWAFEVSTIALEIAQESGVDLTNCTKPAKHARTFTPQYGRLATPEEAWQFSRTTYAIRSYSDQSRPGGLRAFEGEMKGGRLMMRALGFADRDITLFEEPDATWLSLWGTNIPDTVLMGLKGRRLSQVVEGVGDDYEIIGTRTRKGTPLLKLRGPVVPLAAAPEGVDMGWMKLNKREKA